MKITYNNQTKTLTEWSNELMISRQTLAYRLRRMSIDEAFGRPVRGYE